MDNQVPPDSPSTPTPQGSPGPGTATATAALALPQQGMLSKDQMKELKKRLRAETDTDGAALERKRMALAETSAVLGGISEAIMNPATAPTDAMRMQAAASLLGMKGMLDGVGLLVDCVTNRERVPMENGKTGYHRFSIGSHAVEINEALWGVPPDPDGETEEEKDGEAGLLDSFETGVNMLEEIGVSLKAFKDHRGAVSPTKYSQKSSTPVTGKEKVHSEHEAVADDEIKRANTTLSPAEAVEKLKKGGK